ncbi:MAG: hypothetical protein Q7T99_17135 [Pseudomonas sp.]|nr:hypothetical protein [Pseudomonas sp.]
MTEDAPNFGPSDIAGSKFETPNQTNDAETRLIEESLRRKEFSRYFATSALVLLTLAASCCLAFSMWVGWHFLVGLDNQKIREDAIAASQVVITPVVTPLTEKPASKIKAPTVEKSHPAPTAETNKETFYVKILAPLIPASFSSAIAIILFITIARLVTNFEKMGRENPEKDQTEDYGTIAAFFQELVKLIKSFKKE